MGSMRRVLDGARACSCRRSRSRRRRCGYAVGRDDSPVVHACYRVTTEARRRATPSLRLVGGEYRARATSAADLESAGPAGPCGPRGPGRRRRSGRSPGGSCGSGRSAGPPAGADCDLERRIAAAVPGFQTAPACAPPAALQRRRLRAQRHDRPGDPRRARNDDLRRRLRSQRRLLRGARGRYRRDRVADVRHQRRARGGAPRHLRGRARERGRQQPAERQHAGAGGGHGLRAGACVGNAQGAYTLSL